MLFDKRSIFAAAVASLLAATPALAAADVAASLWDQGSDMQMVTGLGFNQGGDQSKATMGIDIEPKTVPAGEVTFLVTNASSDTIHEMIVSPLHSPNERLPYIAKENRVNEDVAGHLGEVEELDPHTGGEVTLKLKPGKYILYCNIPGHYVSGMWTILKVTK